MSPLAAAQESLAALPHIAVSANAAIAPYTRFDIGGPADLFVDAQQETGLIEALRIVRELELPHVLIGGGTNLVVSDNGFRGVVLRFTGNAVSEGHDTLTVGAGAVLQDVVDRSIALGFKGLETMTRIPGYLGGAVYGNAGAYGHSLHEIVETVHFFNGTTTATFSNADCGFRYRTSIFKSRKDWIVLAATLRFVPHDATELRKTAGEISAIRDAKYPPSMKCAGSIFKNILAPELPAAALNEVPKSVIREGKIPSAWFLEQAGVKGLRRGDIQVADYHANLIYNDGAGNARDLLAVIDECKRRVRDRFSFDLEEEVQYVGFDS